MEPTRFQKFNQNIFNILMFGFGLYLIYLIGNLSWKNYHIDQTTNDLRQTTENYEIENQSLNDYLAYYKSKSYQELELRRRLMLKKPGENVVLLPIRKDDDRTLYISQERQLIEYKKEQNKVPNYYKWWKLATASKS